MFYWYIKSDTISMSVKHNYDTNTEKKYNEIIIVQIVKWDKSAEINLK